MSPKVEAMNLEIESMIANNQEEPYVIEDFDTKKRYETINLEMKSTYLSSIQRKRGVNMKVRTFKA